MNAISTCPRKRSGLAAIAVAIAATGLLSAPTFAQEAPETGWTYRVETLATGVNNGYQLAFDPAGRQVFFTDARWRTEDRGPDGTITVRQIGTGKVVLFDAATRRIVATHSYLGLSRNDGNGIEADPFDWTGVEEDSISSMRTTFSPYGIAVDGTTTNADGEVDPTIITTTARARVEEFGYGGSIVVYSASQGGPTDDDRIWLFEDGTPIFNGIRRIAVNTQTHTAFVTNFADARLGEAAVNPGFIAVVDLEMRAVTARIQIPNNWGAIGVVVDEENNLIYVGSLTGEGLFVIDGDAIDTSDPVDLELNNGTITQLEAIVGANARPTYNAELKRLYVSSFGNPNGTITVVDADPESAAYGTTIGRIETGPTNAVEVDGERGLLYSANLGDREVVVFDAETLEELVRLPTRGNALNLGIDPVTRDVWVANFSSAGFTDIFSVFYIEE